MEQEIELAGELLEGAKRLSSRVREKHNRTRSFNLLPSEVGHEILKRALDEDWICQSYYQGLLRLRSTCKQWNRTIDSTPSFWTLLSNSEPVSAWDKILGRNPTSAICMSYTVPCSSSNVREKFIFPTPNHFLDVAIREAHRLQSCRFIVSTE